MTTAVVSPQSSQTSSPFMGRGILLNGSNYSSTSSYHLTPPSKTSSITSHSSSASSSSTDEIISSSDSMPGSSKRKIRFAPLPDPRRAILVTEHGEELPLPDETKDGNCIGMEAQDEADSRTSTPLTHKFAGSKAYFPNSFLSSESTDTLGLSLESLDSGQNTETNTIVGTDDNASDSGFTIVPVPTGPKKARRSSSVPSSERAPSSSSTWASKALKPLLRIPKVAASPLKGSISTEEILTLGTINLFKSASRESLASTRSEQPPMLRERGSSVGTTTSMGHEDKKKGVGGAFRGGYSLRPVTSEAGTSATSRHAANGAFSPGSSMRMKGARMLNGRVYGQKSGSASGRLDKNSNLFKTARDVDPEFVEWGYGGMGSKIGGAASTDLRGRQARQTQSANATSGTTAEKNGKNGSAAVSHDDDDFDGSGMGWVKRRREARERAAKLEQERQEREGVGGNAESKVDGKVKSEDKGADMDGQAQEVEIQRETPRIEVHTASPIRESTPAPTHHEDGDKEENASTPVGASAQSHANDTAKDGKKEPDHVYTAVNIPAHWHPHHTHSHSHHAHPHLPHLQERGPGSASSTPMGVRSLSPQVGVSTPDEVPAQFIQGVIGHGPAVEKESIPVEEVGTPRSPESSTSSTSEFDDEDESKDDEEEGEETPDSDNEEDELDLEQEEEKNRLTALGAGVEKISRHKE